MPAKRDVEFIPCFPLQAGRWADVSGKTPGLGKRDGGCESQQDPKSPGCRGETWNPAPVGRFGMEPQHGPAPSPLEPLQPCWPYSIPFQLIVLKPFAHPAPPKPPCPQLCSWVRMGVPPVTPRQGSGSPPILGRTLTRAPQPVWMQYPGSWCLMCPLSIVSVTRDSSPLPQAHPTGRPCFSSGKAAAEETPNHFPTI